MPLKSDSRICSVVMVVTVLWVTLWSGCALRKIRSLENEIRYERSKSVILLSDVSPKEWIVEPEWVTATRSSEPRITDVSLKQWRKK